MFLYHSFIAYINDRCRCGFVRDRLSDEVFQCFDSSPQTVTYRAVLHGTASATSSELISQIEQWTVEGATMRVQHTLLNVTRTCAIAASSFKAGQQCPGEEILTNETMNHPLNETQTDLDYTSFIIGGSAAAVAIITIIIIVIAAALVTNKCRKRQKVRLRNDQNTDV